METSPAAISGMNIGTKKGETRSGPLVMYSEHWSSKVCIPPIPLPMTTPVRSADGTDLSRPAWVTAWCAAAIANWANRSSRRASFRSMYCSGSNSLTSQANRTLSLLASNLAIGAAPERPASRPLQVDSTSVPTGVTSPRPVTTTRCAKLFPDLGVEITQGISNGAELFGVLVGDVDVELLLEGHDELDRVEAVGAEILHEARLVRQLLPLDAEFLDNDVL